MSKSTFIVAGVLNPDSEDGESFFILVGRRASRRQIRARARRNARAEGMPTTYIWTFRARPPISVMPNDRVEFMR